MHFLVCDQFCQVGAIQIHHEQTYPPTLAIRVLSGGRLANKLIVGIFVDEVGGSPVTSPGP
ncbi:MAG: hypothetical protein EHM40_19300 [Chloroflexi bacterium]|nr:MAG: hypothetical protein EHM40_19300 [Chloroflexota bacterium]